MAKITNPFTIIALHGNGGGGFRFERLLPYLPREIKFIAPTFPGFAGIATNKQLEQLSDFAHWLVPLTQTITTPLILFGTGIGGSIALEFAQHYPLEGLILHAPVGTRLNKRWFPRLMRQPFMSQLGQLVFSSTMTRPIFKQWLFHKPIPETYVNRFFEAYRQSDLFGQMFQIITDDWFCKLAPINTPTALVWGAKERVLNIEQLHDYKALFPNHFVHIEPHWDHFPMIEQPAHFAQVLVDVCQKLLNASQ